MGSFENVFLVFIGNLVDVSVWSSSTGLFTHYCYANEVGRHTKPSKFWSDDGIQRTP